jgi:hypothetical protein
VGRQVAAARRADIRAGEHAVVRAHAPLLERHACCSLQRVAVEQLQGVAIQRFGEQRRSLRAVHILTTLEHRVGLIPHPF